MLQIAVTGPLGPSGGNQQANSTQTEEIQKSEKSDILESATHTLTLEKSNILMLGPTGSG